ncbi:E3 ubiquitin-protein ligase BRE1A-like [Monomorium pharaonis]|uniref:E3 ubiquitin-protein ligase BRE1A-like n=1 Tax=Monomorium pharaonis TaxID=307658 RepID=UPI0017473561|nr:E3 ubiquitin-protein ligase BRE1A-like [Monomorium pharaonis]
MEGEKKNETIRNEISMEEGSQENEDQEERKETYSGAKWKIKNEYLKDIKREIDIKGSYGKLFKIRKDAIKEDVRRKVCNKEISKSGRDRSEENEMQEVEMRKSEEEEEEDRAENREISKQTTGDEVTKKVNKNKMIRSNGRLVYEGDCRIDDKDRTIEKERFKINHKEEIGLEAVIQQKGRTNNKAHNVTRIAMYMVKKGYKVQDIVSIGHNKAMVYFRNIEEANRCLEQEEKGKREDKMVSFSIPNRSKRCKGVISDWDNEMSLRDLYEAIEDKEKILQIERMKKRRYNKATKEITEEYLHQVIIAWEGGERPREISLWQGLIKMRVRAFVENVIQCYNCYGFGHIKERCFRKKICMICGDYYHEKCERKIECINCGGNHRPTDKKCPIYEHNYQVKKVMAERNMSFMEAKDALRKEKGQQIRRGDIQEERWPGIPKPDDRRPSVYYETNRPNGSEKETYAQIANKTRIEKPREEYSNIKYRKELEEGYKDRERKKIREEREREGRKEKTGMKDWHGYENWRMEEIRKENYGIVMRKCEKKNLEDREKREEEEIIRCLHIIEGWGEDIQEMKRKIQKILEGNVKERQEGRGRVRSVREKDQFQIRELYNRSEHNDY